MATTIPSVDELTAKIRAARAARKAAALKAAGEQEAKRKALIETLSRPSGLSDDQLLERAALLVNRAVENADTAIQVFRFPHALCIDNGRALSQRESGWENTLVGVPKDIYDFWKRWLRPKGYRIRFEIIDYPGGMPGDIGITLAWNAEDKG